jgi:hypothetical protein
VAQTTKRKTGKTHITWCTKGRARYQGNIQFFQTISRQLSTTMMLLSWQVPVAAMIKVANMLKCHWEGMLLHYSHSSFRFIVMIGFLLLTNKWIANHSYYAKVSQYNSLKRLLWRLGVECNNNDVTELASSCGSDD